MKNRRKFALKKTFYFSLLIFFALSVALITKYVRFGKIEQRLEVILHPSIENVPVDIRGHFYLVVLIGQSNMVGKGSFPSEMLTNPKIWVFGNDYHWRIASEPIDDPTGQIDLVSLDEDPGYSAATAFARYVKTAFGNRIYIGLIPCAKSSSSIEQWAQNYIRNSLYGSCLYRIREASHVGNLSSILIFQGEAETVESNWPVTYIPKPNTYRQVFESFILDLRRDLGNLKLPIVFAQLGAYPPNSHFNEGAWRVVQTQQGQVDFDCVAMIKTADLSKNGEVHFTRFAYDEIGKRFGSALLDLINIENCPWP